MVSNALSSRRGLLLRPKVCQSDEDEELPPPPPVTECELQPEETTAMPFGPVFFEARACNLAKDPLELWDYEVILQTSTLGTTEDVENCTPLNPTFIAENTGFEGDEVVTLHFLQDAVIVCTKTALIHWEMP